MITLMNLALMQLWNNQKVVDGITATRQCNKYL